MTRFPLVRLLIEHETTYRYGQAVSFGKHRVMLKPRESHDVSVVAMRLECEPSASVVWYQDVFSNSVVDLQFHAPGDTLRIASTVLIDHRGSESLAIPLDLEASKIPIRYPEMEAADLEATARVHHHACSAHVTAFVDPTLRKWRHQPDQLLAELNQRIKSELQYAERHTPGVQVPSETLSSGGGTCRDYALLFMEAARSMGFASRFVSGYLHDPASDGIVGGGNTHAWAQIYLPGPGWVEYDPTNGLINSPNLIRVAVVRDPVQAVPIGGSFSGPKDVNQELAVHVSVRAVPLDTQLTDLSGENSQVFGNIS